MLQGFLEVWENRKTKSGRKIPISVLVLPAKNGGATKPPLFSFSGGPGGPGTDLLYRFLRDYKDLNYERDIVMIDQRGTGKSNPLGCKFLENRLILEDYLSEMYPEEVIKNCFDSLSAIADLSQYTTPNIADDIDEMRAWLGYDKIDIIGFSYGTRLAQVYLKKTSRKHKQHYSFRSCYHNIKNAASSCFRRAARD
ncbi:MAG: alpha/beta hydrolase [Chloroflexia bacterium]|nr:alpha/beta hydrolase [Chloroflexia bacterium]